MKTIKSETQKPEATKLSFDELRLVSGGVEAVVPGVGGAY